MTKRQLEELLHHESFLHWLARRLLRDAARADDVVQETWLAVLHSNKSPSEIHRGWLAAVLRNLARRKLREERRRVRREQLVARPQISAPAPSRLDAEELRVRLAKLVLRLPDHYREALLLRYYEGLEPIEIAARTGVAASTVRTRIQRGLARIRGELDGSAFSLAPLLQLIATTKPTRSVRLAPFAAAAVILIGVLGAWRSDPAARRAERRGVAAARRVEDSLRTLPETRSTSAVVRSESVIRSLPAPVLTGRVELPHGVAREFVQLELTAPGSETIVRLKVRDHFAIDLTPLLGTTSLRLSATHPECETLTRVLSPSAREVTITLQRSPLFEPELLVPALPDGEPAAPAEEKAPRIPTVRSPSVFLTATVHLPQDLAPEPIAVAVCRAGRCLRFRIPPGRRVRLDVGTLLTGAPAAQLVVRAASRHTLMEQRVLPVWAGPRLDSLVLHLQSGRLVRGRVVWEHGAAAAGATVATIGRGSSLLGATTTDAGGRFELVLPRRIPVSLLALASGAVPVAAQPAEQIQLVLRGGVEVTGIVRGYAGHVRLFANTTGNPLRTRIGTVSWTASGPRWSALVAAVDDRGAFSFRGLEPGLYRVRCAGEQQEVIAPGKVEFVPRLRPLNVVATDRGAPVSDVLVRLNDLAVRTDADGRAKFDVAEGADATVRTEAQGFAPVLRKTTDRAELAVDLISVARLGGLEITLAGDAPLLATARVTLHGTKPEARLVALRDGALRIGGILAGNYEVVVDPGGWYFPVRTTATVIAGEVARIELHPTAGGRIRAAGELRLERAPEFRAIAQLSTSAQPYTSDALVAPGRYILWFVSRGAVAVEVSAGERVEVALRE